MKAREEEKSGWVQSGGCRQVGTRSRESLTGKAKLCERIILVNEAGRGGPTGGTGLGRGSSAQSSAKRKGGRHIVGGGRDCRVV
ncbi:hypothetical protein BS50DRAFT_121506 [Corynespora cassiicola Philippines]|uniref:Uncharacterized protein n=1 Tax=Corynespora cassiicola Philippines TaxID=1448308 RepID=A0A2T2NAQ4_CORCC|nr:hypothetical protein BS50DRAFT_121506 [Corynespora cassiicola Philippines]